MRLIFFKNVKLIPAASHLMKSNARDTELVRLNRLLLASAYPELRDDVLLDGRWLGKADTIILVGKSGDHLISLKSSWS
jgi:hypothetical protein